MGLKIPGVKPFYEPGDTVSFDNVDINGFVTTNATQILLSFHLGKNLSKQVSSFLLLSGTVVFRGVNGYIDESNTRKNLNSYTVTMAKGSEAIIAMALTKPSPFLSAKNNTPVSAFIENCTIKFN